MFVEVSHPAPGVAMVALDRTERLNALSTAVADDLLEAIRTIAADAGTGAMILTGRGRGFCAGGDVREMRTNRAKTIDQRRQDLARMHEIPRLLRAMPQPVVAAVAGPAYGAGFGLALGCDLVLAADDARFGTAFLKQGLASDFGLAYQLVRLAGPAMARRLIYLDEVLTANAAAEAGLVAQVVPRAELAAQALDCATRLARLPADARLAMKRLLAMAETESHEVMLQIETSTQIALVTSAHHAAAVDAFLGGDPHAATKTPQEKRS